jgi:hypothetical protein
MLALGIILILISAGSLVAVLASGTGDEAVVFGNVTMPTLVVFLAGAATLLIFIMGLELFRSGIRRVNQNRKTKKKLRRLERREGQRADGDATAAETTGPTRSTRTRADDEQAPTQPTRTSGDEPYEPPPPPSR